MNPLNDKKRLCARAGWLAAAAIAVVLWAGFAGAGTEEVDAAGRHDLVSRYLKAVYARDYAEAYKYISQRDRRAKSEAAYLRENPSLTGAAAELTRGLADRIEVGPLPAEARAEGTLEVRVKDHRNAIDDFRSVDLRLGKLRLAPYPGLKSSRTRVVGAGPAARPDGPDPLQGRDFCGDGVPGRTPAAAFCGRRPAGHRNPRNSPEDRRAGPGQERRGPHPPRFRAQAGGDHGGDPGSGVDRPERPSRGAGTNSSSRVTSFTKMTDCCKGFRPVSVVSG